MIDPNTLPPVQDAQWQASGAAPSVDRGFVPPQSKPIGDQFEPVIKWLGKNKKLVMILAGQYVLLYLLQKFDLVSAILIAVPVFVMSEAAY